MPSSIISELRGGDGDLFTPSHLIQKLPVWLDAFESGCMSINASNQVASVRNKGFIGGDFVQAVDANKPVLEMGAINGRPALKGYNSATASNLTLADHPGMDHATCSVFAVLRRHTDTGATETFGGKYSATDGFREHRLRLASTDRLTFEYFHTDGAAANTVASSPAATVAMDTNYIMDGQKGPAATTASINGSASGTSFDLDAAATAAFNATADYTLFSRNSLGDPFGGYIGEYMFFNQQLASEERKLVIKYLSKKWGIQPTW